MYMVPQRCSRLEGLERREEGRGEGEGEELSIRVAPLLHCNHDQVDNLETVEKEEER